MMELFYRDDLSKHPPANLLQLLKMLLSLSVHPYVLPEITWWNKRPCAMLQPSKFRARCVTENSLISEIKATGCIGIAEA